MRTRRRLSFSTSSCTALSRGTAKGSVLLCLRGGGPLAVAGAAEMSMAQATRNDVEPRLALMYVALLRWHESAVYCQVFFQLGLAQSAPRIRAALTIC